jgi:signal transduction histidine kinase
VVDALLAPYRSRPFNPVPARLGDVVRGTARLMDYHLRYHLVKMELDVDDGPEVLVDPGQVEQLLINLLSNAVKSMQGRPRKVLRLRVKATERENLIEVSDTGCGIPRDHLSGLFTRGFTASADGPGHGLGLTLSDEIARRHGGLITVESVVGEGTTYTVHLPRVGVELPAAA